jgi:hypothetical protein
VSDTTKVLAPITLKSLKAGTAVTVQGQTAADGLVTATTIETQS